MCLGKGWIAVLMYLRIKGILILSVVLIANALIVMKFLFLGW